MSQHAQNHPANQGQTIKALTEGQPDFIDITTPSTPGNELAILHGLDRIPKGYAIVNSPYQHLVCGRGGSAWTKRRVWLKFSLASTSLTICVF